MTPLCASARPTTKHVTEAARLIAPFVNKTPLLTSSYFDQQSGASLYFKCENFQKTGSFKARGACNAVMSLPAEEAELGVITHSSGNHGQALGYAAAARGIDATVIMPKNAPAVKREAVVGYGARVVGCGPRASDREQVLADLFAERERTFIHPHDDGRVIAGQGTVVLEMLAEQSDLDHIICPVGGGGLISGAVIACEDQGVEVIGAEPAAADDAAQSLRQGRLITYDQPQTVADGLRVPLHGLTWEIVRHGVSDILTVSEEEISSTLAQVWQRMKIVIEPSGAVALAAILAHKDRFSGRKVGVVLTGGNVSDFPLLGGEG